MKMPLLYRWCSVEEERSSSGATWFDGVGNSSLNIQNAQTLRDDLVVPLHPEQLQVGFDFLVPAWRDNDYHCCQVLVGGGNGNSSTTEKGKVDEILLLSHHEMNPLISLDNKSQILVSPPCFL